MPRSLDSTPRTPPEPPPETEERNRGLNDAWPWIPFSVIAVAWTVALGVGLARVFG